MQVHLSDLERWAETADYGKRRSIVYRAQFKIREAALKRGLTSEQVEVARTWKDVVELMRKKDKRSKQ